MAARPKIEKDQMREREREGREKQLQVTRTAKI